MVLDKIQRPNDVKELKEQELPILADEIRQFIIDKVSDNGGHLASNLGVGIKKALRGLKRIDHLLKAPSFLKRGLIYGCFHPADFSGWR